jgi:hypothetical protein
LKTGTENTELEMSRLGRVPPFRSELNFELTGFEIDILPCLNQTGVGLVQVKIDLGSGDGTCGVPCEFDGFRRIYSCAKSGGSVEVTSCEVASWKLDRPHDW